MFVEAHNIEDAFIFLDIEKEVVELHIAYVPVRNVYEDKEPIFPKSNVGGPENNIDKTLI